jgi:hypothetical protein
LGLLLNIIVDNSRIAREPRINCQAEAKRIDLTINIVTDGPSRPSSLLFFMMYEACGNVKIVEQKFSKYFDREKGTAHIASQATESRSDCIQKSTFQFQFDICFAVMPSCIQSFQVLLPDGIAEGYDDGYPTNGYVSLGSPDVDFYSPPGH